MNAAMDKIINRTPAKKFPNKTAPLFKPKDKAPKGKGPKATAVPNKPAKPVPVATKGTPASKASKAKVMPKGHAPRGLPSGFHIHIHMNSPEEMGETTADTETGE
jgi:hypothetical protein